MKKKINSLENRNESYKTSSNVLISFKYAFNGICYVLKTSRNFKGKYSPSKSSFIFRALK